MNYPLAYYINDEVKTLRFHLLAVGEGLMCLIIFPDDITFLFDCNVTNDNEDDVLNYIEAQIPLRKDPETKKQAQWIDIFVNSHRDDDHYRGLSKINAKFPIKSIWDSGQTGAATQSSEYKYYMSLRRTIRKKYGEKAVIVPFPSKNPLVNFHGAEIYCLNSSLYISDTYRFLNYAKFMKYVEDNLLIEGKIQHTNSIVLSIHYGGRRLLLPGDSDYLAWKNKIMPHFKDTGLLKSNVLVASHHGSRSFFTDESINDTIDPKANPLSTYIDHINEIEPSITLISCGRYESAHHPNKEAMEIYKNNTANKQVYTTYKRWDFTGFMDSNGNWTVAPSRFNPKSNIRKNFNIKCVCEHYFDQYQAQSGDDFPIGSILNFSIQSDFGILDPRRKVDVIWEVSNGGVHSDFEHQSIYYKGTHRRDKLTPKHQFTREVSYQGRHLLRCYVHNKRKKIKATQVFVVNGV